MSRLVYYSIPAFLLTMALEALWARRRGREQRLWTGATARGYQGSDSAASIAMGLGNVGIAALMQVVLLGIWTALYQLAPWHLPNVWWTWVLLLVAEDLCYYAFHRTHHGVRLFWAAHINHHSSEYYNLSTALRQSWTTPFTDLPFWLPLPLLGFAPWMILTQHAVSLLYQYWLHTETINRLGWLEHVFNTPSHHRVHHGVDAQYLDRNHGGIFIFWDKLFGTFEPERAPVHYGLTTQLGSRNLITIAFHEWAAIARDVAHARTLGDALRYVFGPPGWSPDGSRQTSAQLRAAAEACRVPEGVVS
jgi:sterol desaturase/sphingolipid hydroxylase (fatty acid hydroxylase superfamily)